MRASGQQPSRVGRVGWVIGWVVGSVVVVLAMTSCSSTPDAGPQIPVATGSVTTSLAPATSAPAITAPSPWTPEQQQAIDAYLGFDRAFTEASAIPDPQYPPLGDFAAGEFLTKNRQKIGAVKLAGRAFRVPDPSQAAIETQAAFTREAGVELFVCQVNDSIEYRRATGEVINDGVATRLLDIAVEIIDGSARVTGFQEVTKWPEAELARCREEARTRFAEG